MPIIKVSHKAAPRTTKSTCARVGGSKLPGKSQRRSGPFAVLIGHDRASMDAASSRFERFAAVSQKLARQWHLERIESDIWPF